MSPRPRLQPFATVIRRGNDTVQIGLAPGAGIVLSGLSPGEMGLFSALDGRLDLGALRNASARAGCPPGRTDQLLATLRRHGLLVDGPVADDATPGPMRPTQVGTPDPGSRSAGPRDEDDTGPVAATRTRCLPVDPRVTSSVRGSDAPGSRPAPTPAVITRGDADLAPEAASASAAYRGAADGLAVVGARAARRVLVDGSGRLVDLVAQTLRQGGIGAVHAGGGVGGWWALNSPDKGADERPDLVVLVASGALAVGSGDFWLRHSVPHLPVVASGHRLTVGPLVVAGGPCLRCLDFHRTERDPAWPHVLAQLSHSPPGDVPPVEPDSVLTALAAGLTAQFVHSLLDEVRTPPSGVSVELAFGDLGVLARRWVPHPRCECRASRETMAS